tara:strand:+ start:3516 stop:3758 length:243 start_codon:yes stop_codon:yes gene_type:complete
MFSAFLYKLKVDKDDTISLRYGEITSSLNKTFEDSESKTSNNLHVTMAIEILMIILMGTQDFDGKEISIDNDPFDSRRFY